MKTYIVSALLGLSLSLANAQSYIADLNGAQDGGGARQGTGHVELTLSGTTLSLSGSYSGLTAPATAGHIHGPSGLFPASASVIYPLDSLGILSLGATSGTYSGSLTLAPLLSGTYTVAQQIADLNNGQWYLNIHNSGAFPGGEIRGQILLVVPEPSSLALLGLMTAGLLARGGWKPKRGAQH